MTGEKDDYNIIEGQDAGGNDFWVDLRLWGRRINLSVGTEEFYMEVPRLRDPDGEIIAE